MRTTSQPDALTAGWVDEICDRFEQAWRGGQPLRIETHLEGAEGSARLLLLRELLLLEIDLRLESGESPGKEEYLERFASAAGLIEEIFQEVTQSHVTSAATTIGVPDSATPADASAQAAGVPPEFESFGDYEVLEQLGQGGMGVVYRARQRSANRIVALKLIRHDHLSGLPGAHRQEIVDRFHNEALATASLDHDHIVTVYEVGEIEGQHFFSMQYVGGPSLSQVLSKGPMQARQAARRLSPVARALDAAHQCGVLHRDVNPRNLLVDPRDNRLLVADFGLAKLRETDVALTKAGTTFGSPPYMAPEQVRDAANVSEAADIYGLGATLYQMLTGRPPFQAATVADTLCQVLSEQPASPRELNPSIDRDLDTICMKCLEKDPARRYRSAEEVAEELDRFVRREPIRARPIGHLGRFCRWCRRNPALATMVITAATLLTILSLVAGVAAIREAYHRAEAEHSFALMRQGQDEQMQLVWENPAMKSRGLERLRLDLLESALKRYDELVRRRPDDLDLLADQARAYYRLASICEETGQSEEAEEDYQAALGIQQRVCQMDAANDAYKRDWAESFAALGRLYRKTGRFDEAEHAVQRALRVCLQLPGGDPENRRELADSHADLGTLKEAFGDSSDAMRLRKEELAIREELANRYPQAAEYQRDLAECLASMAGLHFESGEEEEAETYYNRAVEISEGLPLEGAPEDHEALAVASSNIGLFYLDLYLGQLKDRSDEAEAKLLEQAEANLLEAQKIMELLAKEHRDVPRYRSNLAAGWHSLAEVYRANQRFEEAGSALQKAIGICDELVADFPSLLQCHVDLASGYHNLAVHHLATAQAETTGEAAPEALEAAETAEQKAFDIFEELAKKYPRIPDLRSDFARVLISFGELYMDTERLVPAEGVFQTAVAELTRLVGEYPTVQAYRRRLATGLIRHSETCAILGELAQQEGAFQEARRWYTSALDARLKLEEGSPEPYVSSLVLISAMQRAMLSGIQGRHADALADWQLAIERAPPEHRQSLQMEAAVSLARSGEHAAAATKAEEILNAQGAEAPSGDLAFSAARVLAQASRAAKLDGDLDKPTAEQQRQTCLSKAIDYLRKAHRAGFFEGEEARQRLRSEPDLDPLRQHDDFRKLLDEIGVDPDAEPKTVPEEVQPRVASGAKRPLAVV